MAIRSICAFVVASLILEANPAFAGLVASADLVATPQGSDFNYNITLQNTGTTTVGTFWMAWVPAGYDFLATRPLSVTAPVGWYGYVTNNGPGDGFGVEFYSYSPAYYLAAGHSLSSFAFESADTPASIAGTSAFYPGSPTATSVVYSGGPFSDAGYQFVASVTTASVPEPSSLFLVAIVAAALGFGCTRRRRLLIT
jgi:hypothetical protein